MVTSNTLWFCCSFFMYAKATPTIVLKFETELIIEALIESILGHCFMDHEFLMQFSCVMRFIGAAVLPYRTRGRTASNKQMKTLSFHSAVLYRPRN